MQEFISTNSHLQGHRSVFGDSHGLSSVVCHSFENCPFQLRRANFCIFNCYRVRFDYFLHAISEASMSAEYPGAAPPPEGVVPDLENPQDVLQTVMYATQGLTIVFVTVFIAMRIWSKSRLLGNTLSWDDCECCRCCGCGPIR